MPDPCPFCSGPLAGNHTTRVIHEWPDTIAIEPLDPVVPGHVIVIPRVHVDNALTDPAVTGLVHQRAADLARHLESMAAWDLEAFPNEKEWAGIEGVNLITSVGAAATATVPHLHVHVIPRRVGDGLMLPWTGQVTT